MWEASPDADIKVRRPFPLWILAFFLFPICYLLFPAASWAEEPIILPEKIILGEDKASIESQPSLTLPSPEKEIPPISTREIITEETFLLKSRFLFGEDKRRLIHLTGGEVSLFLHLGILYEESDGWRPDSKFKTFSILLPFSLSSSEYKITFSPEYFQKRMELPGMEGLSSLGKRRNSLDKFSFKIEKGKEIELSISGERARVKNSLLPSSEAKYGNFSFLLHQDEYSFFLEAEGEELKDAYHRSLFGLGIGKKTEINPSLNLSTSLFVKKGKEINARLLPSASLSYRLGDNNYFLDLSSTLSYPRFSDLYLKENWSKVNEKRLREERRRKVEAGFRHNFSKGSILISGFGEEDKDRFIWDLKDELYKPVNLNRAISYGVRTGLSYNLPYLWVELDWTKRNIESKDIFFKEVPDFPEEEGSLKLTFPYLSPFLFQLSLDYQGKRFSGGEELSSSIVGGAEISYNFSKRGRAFLEIENLNNESYYLKRGYPAAGRKFYAGLELCF